MLTHATTVLSKFCGMNHYCDVHWCTWRNFSGDQIMVGWCHVHHFSHTPPHDHSLPPICDFPDEKHVLNSLTLPNDSETLSSLLQTCQTLVQPSQRHQKSCPKANHPLSREKWHVHINTSIQSQMEWYNTHHGFLFDTYIAWASCRNDDTRLPTSLETKYWHSCNLWWVAMSYIICDINEIQPYTVYTFWAGLRWPPVYISWSATSTATSVKLARALTGGKQLEVGDLKRFF